MIKRFTAAVLAMVMLICAFPVAAKAVEVEDLQDKTMDHYAIEYADCRVYEPGQTYYANEYVWVYHNRTKPSPDDVEEGYMWKKLRIVRCGEGMFQHEHVEDGSENDCYDFDDEGNYRPLNCKFGYEHRHDYYAGCMFWEAYHLHQVVEDPDAPPRPVPPPANVEDGFDADPGELHFEINCVNANGEPIPYVGFYIATAQTDENGNVLFDSKSNDPLKQDYVDFKMTNSEGKLRFNALENYLEELPQPWIVYQDGEPFAQIGESNGRYYNQYRFCDTSWILAGGAEGPAFSIAKETVLETESPVKEPGYQDGVLTYVNERFRGQLFISVKFVDEKGRMISGSSCDVTSTSDAGESERVSFPLQQDDPWFYINKDLPAATYTVKSDPPGEIEDYGYLDTTYEVLTVKTEDGQFKEEWTEGTSAAVDVALDTASFRITHRYKKGTVPNKIGVLTVDEDGTGCNGATYELYDIYGNSMGIFTEEDSYFEIVSQDVAASAVEGEIVTLQLLQLNGPADHEPSNEVYEIDVTMENGEITMDLRSPDGKDSEIEGVKTAVFTNRKKDMSNAVIIQAVNSETGEPLTGGIYEAYDENGVRRRAFDLSGESSLRVHDFEEFIPGKNSAEFTLKQTAPPDGGYDLSDDEYTVTVTMENGKPKVDLTKKDQSLLARVAQAIGFAEGERGEYNEQIAQFRNDKIPGPVIIINSVDAENMGDTLDVTYTLLQDDGSNHTVAKYVKDTLDMTPYAYDGETRRFILKQDEDSVPAGYEPADNSFRIEVTKENGVLRTDISEVKGDGSGVGREGEYQTVTFRNQKKLEKAQISLSLNDIVTEWGEGCKTDADYEKNLRSKSYQFILEWKYNGEDPKSEILTVAPGKMGTFTAQLPLNAEYTVKPYSEEGTENWFHTALTGKYEGTVTELQLGKITNVTATNTFKIVPGQYVPALDLTVVDAGDVKKPLKGAAFTLTGKTLKDPVLLESAEDGSLEIKDLAATPALYELKQTKAVDGYDMLDKPVEISVEYAYDLVNTGDADNTEKKIVQNLMVFASYADEDMVKNGYIKNAPKKAAPGTAKIQLTLDEIQIKWNGGKEDAGKREDFATSEYEFALFLMDEKGNWKEDPNHLTLYKGEKTKTGTFKKEVPVGAKYKIAVVGSDHLYDVVFSGGAVSQQNGSACEAVAEQGGTINLTVKPRYEIMPGNYVPELYMRKVYARNKSKTLAGAKFLLKDEDGGVIAEFVTIRDGIVAIGHQFEQYPARYTLKEVKAPDDYVPLATVIEIDVSYEYTAITQGGKTYALQNLVARPYHKEVEKGPEDWYYIKNSHVNDLPQTGDAFNLILWTGLLTISAAALAVLLLGKKRSWKRNNHAE